MHDEPRPRAVRAALAVALLLAAAPSPAVAASLADKLHAFVEANATIFAADIDPVPDFVTTPIEKLGVRAIDFPPTSTAPGFTYRFDFESESYVREDAALGPVFSERPETVGRRRLELGASFLWGDLDTVDGGQFGAVRTGSVPFFAEGIGDVRAATAFDIRRFDLRTEMWNFSATYGLTDRFDVNVLLPVLHTSLDLEAFRQDTLRDAGGRVLVSSRPTRVDFAADAFGPGDLLLRFKYRALEGTAGAVALGLTVRAPSGNPGNFQGLGDWTVTPLIVAARAVGRSHLHCSLGFELNAVDLERNRLRYTAGVTVPLWRRLGLFADLLGSSGTSDDQFVLRSVIPASPPRGVGVKRVATSADGTIETVAFVPRSDVIDFAIGLKHEAFGRLVAFVGAIVPATDAGLRADVVPTAGLQLLF